ncbi:ImuA family protein [Pedobacter paludis]|uniref:Error-prone repair protein ImuA n=1 Tax=Pedobacter paludis TaxID=2203212 RepID=A0A317EU72_9SPHI|nr:Error-prone repair protein ImuA [Pedobacter paludis]PWS30254.1 Error-prone repair protein ImuA [Pedobacter paludis]
MLLKFSFSLKIPRSMLSGKKAIVSQLQERILSLEGYKPGVEGRAMSSGAGCLDAIFPMGRIPLGVLHEFIAGDMESLASTGGFIASLLARLMAGKGGCMWVSASRKIFPSALAAFGLSPERVVFIDLASDRDVLWAAEEALKCDGLSAVVMEVSVISFAQSRRLQLVMEKSRVSCFTLRKNMEKLSSTVAAVRWQVSALPSAPKDGLPGLGFARWQVELLKVKNGIPGSVVLECVNGKLSAVDIMDDLDMEEREAQYG